MSHVDIPLNGLSVFIGIPAGRDLPVLTVRSLFATQAKLLQLGISCSLGMIAGSAVIQWARDEVVDAFLQTDANRLFWIDSDIAWEPEQFVRLLAISKLPGHEVVCATYPAKVEQPTFFVNYDALKVDGLGLMEINGAGLGFTVMSREVIESLAANADKVMDDVAKRSIATVFRIDAKEGKRRGEDMAFFADVRSLGYSVWLDTAIDLGHVGQKVFRGSIRDAVAL